MAEPVTTHIIRSAAAGPQPCNTLVFLTCRVPGIDVGTVNGETTRSRLKFQTEFKLDGYVQSEYDWYVANTLVSATASLRFLNTTTDLTFLMAVDTVEPEIQQLDGSLAFYCRLAARMEDDAWFRGREELVIQATLAAYVLCYEPRVERPPSGDQRTPWALGVSEGIKFTELHRKSDRSTAALAAPAAAQPQRDCR